MRFDAEKTLHVIVNQFFYLPYYFALYSYLFCVQEYLEMLKYSNTHMIYGFCNVCCNLFRIYSSITFDASVDLISTTFLTRQEKEYIFKIYVIGILLTTVHPNVIQFV